MGAAGLTKSQEFVASRFIADVCCYILASYVNIINIKKKKMLYTPIILRVLLWV